MARKKATEHDHSPPLTKKPIRTSVRMQKSSATPGSGDATEDEKKPMEQHINLKVKGQTTMRVWDVLFSEGAQVLLHVALAIFMMKEDELLVAHHAGDIVKILQKTTHRLFDPEDLLTVTFEKIRSITTNNISKQRKRQEPAVMAALDQRLRRLNSVKVDVDEN